MPEDIARKYIFLNITEPDQTRQKEFQISVKKNATNDYRRYQRMKLTQDYRKSKSKASTLTLHILPKDSVTLTATPDAGNNDGHAHEPYHNARPGPCAVLAQGTDPDSTGLRKLLPKKRKMACRSPDKTRHAKEGDHPFNVEVYDPSTILSASMEDPFDTCPTDGQQGYYFLINHFIITIAPAFLPIDRGLEQNPVNRLWTWHSLNSPVLSNALLLCSSVHLDFLLRQKESSHTLFYRWETVRLVNEALGTSLEGISDCTVAAVALLVACGNITNNCEEIILHMSALKRMIEMRGGLGNLGWNKTLGMFISWQDLIASTTVGMLPQLAYESLPPPRLPVCNDIEKGESSCEHPRPHLSLTTIKPNHRVNAYGEIHDILSEIRHLTIVVESFNRSRGATPIEMLSFSKARSALEYRLLLMKDSTEIMCNESQLIYEACRISAVIYINHVLHEFDPAFQILRKLKERLIETIKAGESVFWELEKSESILFLWVLFMGGLLADGQNELRWFARRISHVMQTLGLSTWDVVQEYLMEVLWVKRMQNSACDSLWRELNCSPEE